MPKIWPVHGRQNAGGNTRAVQCKERSGSHQTALSCGTPSYFNSAAPLQREIRLCEYHYFTVSSRLSSQTGFQKPGALNTSNYTHTWSYMQGKLAQYQTYAEGARMLSLSNTSHNKDMREQPSSTRKLNKGKATHCMRHHATKCCQAVWKADSPHCLLLAPVKRGQVPREPLPWQNPICERKKKRQSRCKCSIHLGQICGSIISQSMNNLRKSSRPAMKDTLFSSRHDNNCKTSLLTQKDPPTHTDTLCGRNKSQLCSASKSCWNIWNGWDEHSNQDSECLYECL